MNQFFQMLKKDHEEVKEILGQLKETKESASKKREDGTSHEGRGKYLLSTLDGEERISRRCSGGDGGAPCE